MLRVLRSPLARSPKVQPHKDEPAKKPRRSDMDHPLSSLDAGGVVLFGSSSSSPAAEDSSRPGSPDSIFASPSPSSIMTPTTKRREANYKCPKVKFSDVDARDVGTPDAWIPRNPELVRLTGRHPFNAEPTLSKLETSGFITPTSVHYVRK